MAAHLSGKLTRVLRGQIARQFFAAILVALALFLRLALTNRSITLPTYITFYPAVIFAALLGGIWAGLLATVLTALAVDYLLLPPIGHFSINSTSDIVSMFIFSLSGVSISVVMELYIRNREKLTTLQIETAVQTERRKAEMAHEMAESVRAERQRFLDVLETLPVMISLMTPDYRIAYANRSYRDKYGACEGQLCYESSFERSTPCDFCESLKVLETSQHSHWEMNVKDGALVEAHVFPFTDLDGSPLILKMDVDITQRKLAEIEQEELRRHLEYMVTERTRHLSESQAKLATALASMADSVLITDAEGRFVESNEAFATFYRFKSKAECASNFDEFKSIFEVSLQNGEPAPLEMYAIQRALRGETATNVEYRLRRKDTGESWIGSVSFSPIRDKDGTITGSVVTAHDITERKRAEKALQESESRYRNLFNTMNEGFCIIEVLFDAAGKPEDYRFIEMNSAFEKQTGLHDAVGKRMRELAPDHEEHWFEIYGKIALTGEPQHFINEARALNRWYDVHAYRVGTPEMRRVAIVFNDFSDYKQAEEELRKLNRTLKALSNSNQAILHAADERSFLEEVCRIVTRDCGHAMVWIGIAEHDEGKTVRPVANSGFDDGYLESISITWDESECGRGPTGTAIRTGKPAMCRNMHTDPVFVLWREEAIKRGYASSVAIPLKAQDKAWGAITIYSKEPDSFSEGEVDLLKELAGDIELGVQTLRLRASQAHAEAALIESKELLGLFVEYAPAALAMLDDKMRYLHVSQRWKSDYGLVDWDLIGLSHYDVFPEITERWKEIHRRGLKGEVLNCESDLFERADGSEQWIRWEIRPWHESEGKVGGIVIFSEDITARKKAQEALLQSEKDAFQRQQLQALAARLQQVREEERKMVARDLHDHIGQIMTAIKMDVSWVVRHLPKSNDEMHDRLARSIEFVNDGVRSVRKICSGLRPGILDDLGLAPALEWQAKEFSNRTGIDCQVSVPPGDLHMDGDRATAIFRVFQECLTNIARHAEARSVRASLSEQDGDIILIVEDDGKGFLESEVSDSLGVLGMKERAQGCGGTAQVSSLQGKGTTITVRVPALAASTEKD